MTNKGPKHKVPLPVRLERVAVPEEEHLGQLLVPRPRHEADLCPPVPHRLVLGRKALSLNREVVCFHLFLTLVWVFRGCLASFIEPWQLQLIPAAAIGQLIASDALATVMVTHM